LDKAVKKPTFDDPNEQIKLNMKFTSNNIRVNLIPVASSKKKAAAPDEKDQGQAKEVQTERQVIIQATSVKILKTRKTVAYQELITENMSMI
jgi:cullin 1